MWLDALILLPLVTLGVWRCVTKGRWGSLLACIVAAIVTCWYTGYMIVLFAILYAVLEWMVARFDGREHLPWQRVVMLMAGVFCWALLLSAWMFYPTVAAQMSSWSLSKTIALCGASVVLAALGVVLLRGMLSDRAVTIMCVAAIVCVVVLAVVLAIYLGLDTVVSRLTNKEWLLSASKRSLASSMFLGTWSLDSSPQLFAGYLPMLGSLCLLLCPRIKRKVRIVVLVFLSVLLLSVVVRPLYYVWCGLRAPNGFYCRISFLFVFGLIWSAAYYLNVVRGTPCALKQRREIVLSTLLLVLASIAGSLVATNRDGRVIALGVVLIVAYAMFLCSMARKLARAFLIVLVFAELAVSGCLALPSVYTGYTQEAHETYVSTASQELTALFEADDSAYRVEKTYARAGLAALNEGLALGFNRISSYSSAYNASAVAFLNALGYSNEGEFSVTYRQPILPSDSLLGVRYVFSRVPINGLEEVDLDGLADGDLLYMNTDALSLAYAASSDITSFSIEDGSNPFERQNQLASAILGRDVVLFSTLDATLVADDDDVRSWEVEVPAESVAYSWIDSSSGVAYLYSVDDETAFWANDPHAADGAQDNWRFSHAIRTLGEVQDIDHIVMVSLISTQGTSGEPLPDDAVCLFYALDMDVYEELISALAEEQAEVSQWSDARFTGTIEFSGEKDGVLISIPYDYGWTVRVNGESVQALSAADGALTFIPLADAGTYTIEMSYMPPMLVEGCIVTGLTCVAFVVRAWWLYGRDKRLRIGKSVL